MGTLGEAEFVTEYTADAAGKQDVRPRPFLLYIITIAVLDRREGYTHNERLFL